MDFQSSPSYAILFLPYLVTVLFFCRFTQFPVRLDEIQGRFKDFQGYIYQEVQGLKELLNNALTEPEMNLKQI